MPSITVNSHIRCERHNLPPTLGIRFIRYIRCKKSIIRCKQTFRISPKTGQYINKKPEERMRTFCERYLFTLQKVSFYRVKGHLSESKRMPFAKR